MERVGNEDEKARIPESLDSGWGGVIKQKTTKQKKRRVMNSEQESKGARAAFERSIKIKNSRRFYWNPLDTTVIVCAGQSYDPTRPDCFNSEAEVREYILEGAREMWDEEMKRAEERAKKREEEQESKEIDK